MTDTPPVDRRNIFDLQYCPDANGDDVLCYPTRALYTGIVFEALKSGGMTLEYGVKNGLKDGPEYAYYAPGYLEALTHYREGHLHGDTIYYYPGGAKMEQSVFEYGILTEEFQWDEDGTVRGHKTIDSADAMYPLLQRLRARYGW